MNAEATRRRFLLEATTVVSLLGTGMATTARAQGPSRKGRKRSTLARPGPMLPPVPAIFLTVKGQPGEPDEISVLWTFVVSGDPPQVGVSAGDEHRASSLLALHRQFVLNVPVASLVHPFDVVDMSSSRVADKFVLAGLTRGAATTVDAPTIEEAPIQLECRVSHVLRVPPARTVFLADVVATTVHEGICEEGGRLIVSSAPFFGMTSGSGEFYTLGQKVGHIGQSVGRSDIRY
jgi:flavin reductase (DIM6/NTAB) family NADH-FMN oxidoreductase RutF